MNNVILKCEKVVKKYDDGALSVQVLNGLDLEVSQGQRQYHRFVRQRQIDTAAYPRRIG